MFRKEATILLQWLAYAQRLTPAGTNGGTMKFEKTFGAIRHKRAQSLGRGADDLSTSKVASSFNRRAKRDFPNRILLRAGLDEPCRLQRFQCPSLKSAVATLCCAVLRVMKVVMQVTTDDAPGTIENLTGFPSRSRAALQAPWRYRSKGACICSVPMTAETLPLVTCACKIGA